MYKISNYNFYIPKQDRVIYFNGITSNVFSVDEKEHQKLQMLFSNLISFEINYTSIFQRFKDWGYIIDENQNEIDILKFRNRKAVFWDRNYKLVLNPTLECNFACWYCYEKHPKGHMSLEVIEKCKRHILYMLKYEKISSLALDWFGGEPLLYFDEVIYPIGLYAKKMCDKYKVPFYHYATTNASKIDIQMIDKMKKIGFSGFQITIDGDENKHNSVRSEKGKPSFGKIIDNVNLLCERLDKIQITLRVNYDDKTLELSDMENVFSMISPENRKHIAVNFQRVWQTIKAGQVENTDRIQLTKKSIGMGFQIPPLANAFGIGIICKCYVDRMFHAEINYDGKVYRCTARDYSDKYVMGELLDSGEIKWNEERMAERYAKATFENEMCLKCRYLPLCMGPCSQKIAETPKENLPQICYLTFAEVRPESVITDYYEQKMKALNNI